MEQNIYKRLARLEAIAALTREEQKTTIEAAYRAACEAKNADEAARLLRKWRDQMLSETDKTMTLDRIKIDTSNALSFLVSLGSAIHGQWGTYRQALRDIPQQPGFPFDVKFPEIPGSEERTKR